MFKIDLGFFKNLKNMNKNTVLISIAVVGIIITGGLIYTSSNSGFSIPNIFGMSKNQVAKNVIDYINNNQLSATPASLVNVSEESGLIKVRIKIDANEFDSYATKDGKLLFPQAFDMSKKESNSSDQNTANQPSAKDNAKAAASVEKTDKPMLDAYVVSRCPYGIQIQRAMSDAVKNQPSLTQYIKARYIGSVSGNTITAMHGEAEAKENLRQICIREEQANKYWDYVGCQMKSSGTETSCEQSTGIDSAGLNACIANSNRGVAYAKEDFDLTSKYNIQGSPTLVLNGVVVSESNFGGRSSDAIRAMICAASKTEPSFCSTTLNTAVAAVSFSATYEGAAGSGNSGAAGADCAPAQ